MKQQPSTHISFRTILPALIFIIVLDVAYLGGDGPTRAFIQVNTLLWTILIVLFPLLALIRQGLSLREIGFGGTSPLLRYLAGCLVGVLWRLLTQLFVNAQSLFSGQFWNGQITWLTMLNGLVIVPLGEEIFFRGFLQRGLQSRVGTWWAIGIQALLFALHPAHLAQSGFHFGSFLCFGLIAGLIYSKTQSLYPLLGAHGMANILPEALHLIIEWWWTTDWIFPL